MCELTHKVSSPSVVPFEILITHALQNSNYFPTSSDPGFHGARNIEGTWPTDTRGGRRSSSRHASQNNHYMSLGTRPNGGSTKESSTSPVEKPPQETLIAKIRNMSQSALEETLKTQPDYEPNQETLREDHFIQAMLIVKRGSSDLNTSVPRWAKMDTGSPVSLVREETLEGLGIVPFRFGSDPLTGLVQDAVVEPVGLESIFWFDPADTREKPQIFQTNFKVLPKGTTRAFDFLLGADWLRAAQLQLAREPRDGRHTQTQPSVLYLRVLNQMQ